MASDLPSVFFDTSTLVSGVISPSDGTGAIRDLCEAKVLRLVLSREVLIEADRVFEGKLAHLLDRYRDLIRALAPELADDPTPDETQRASRLMPLHDAPILAAAIKARPDYLITLNTRHCCTQRVRRAVSFQVLSPVEFWEAWRDGFSPS